MQCDALCCSLMQRVAVCCSVLILQYVSLDACDLSKKSVQLGRPSFFRGSESEYISSFVRAAVCCCSVLHCAALCCSVLHCAALCCIALLSRV